MERIVLEKQQLTPTFIGAWTISPLSICDELIAYFESNKNKQKKWRAALGVELSSAFLRNSIQIKQLNQIINIDLRCCCPTNLEFPNKQSHRVVQNK